MREKQSGKQISRARETESMRWVGNPCKGEAPSHLPNRTCHPLRGVSAVVLVVCPSSLRTDSSLHLIPWDPYHFLG